VTTQGPASAPASCSAPASGKVLASFFGASPSRPASAPLLTSQFGQGTEMHQGSNTSNPFLIAFRPHRGFVQQGTALEQQGSSWPYSSNSSAIMSPKVDSIAFYVVHMTMWSKLRIVWMGKNPLLASQWFDV
jgi:hypothetical protein